MTTKHRIKIHEIAEAQFEPDAIGTYVIHWERLWELLDKALDTYKFPEGGKGFITLPKEATALVCPGVARRDRLSDVNSVIREHRGRKDVYLNRASLSHSCMADKVSVVIYTKEAYIKDKCALVEHLDSFIKNLREELADIDYVWITTIASIGPADPPVSPYRFTSNLANKGSMGVEYDMASAVLNVAIDEAEDSVEYWDEWITVAAPKMD